MNTSYAVFCGIDVGKGEHHVVGLDASGDRLYDKPMPNDEMKLRAVFDDLARYGPVLRWQDLGHGRPSCGGHPTRTGKRAAHCSSSSVGLHKVLFRVLPCSVASCRVRRGRSRRTTRCIARLAKGQL